LGDDGRMIGAIILAVVIVVVIPVGLFLTGAIAAGVLGNLFTHNATSTHEGSELNDIW
jgi:predicted branched-subunit amino acid permease